MLVRDRVARIGPTLLAALLLSIASCASVPSGVRVWVEAPLEVDLGDEFTIGAVVENSSSSEVELVDLDIADSYLRGIAIVSTNPRFYELMHVPLDNTMSYTFNQPVAPGGTLRVALRAVAEDSGTFQGDFDFCIDSMLACVYYTVTTIVRP